MGVGNPTSLELSFIVDLDISWVGYVGIFELNCHFLPPRQVLMVDGEIQLFLCNAWVFLLNNSTSITCLCEFSAGCILSEIQHLEI